MRSFLAELKDRNTTLNWFGIYNLAVAIICIILMQFDSMQILGVDRWLKPTKFFFAVFIMTWTMEVSQAFKKYSLEGIEHTQWGSYF